MRITRVLGFALLTAAAGFAVGQTMPALDSSPVTLATLPLKLPAVGNLEAVDKWRFGRVQRIERRSGSDDILIHIRTADEQVHRIVGPREPLTRLARACGWIDGDWRKVAGRRDYVERMIAFDVDDEGRLIAVISLEPFNRSRARLRRAFSSG